MAVVEFLRLVSRGMHGRRSLEKAIKDRDIGSFDSFLQTQIDAGLVITSRGGHCYLTRKGYAAVPVERHVDQSVYVPPRRPPRRPGSDWLGIPSLMGGEPQPYVPHV